MTKLWGLAGAHLTGAHLVGVLVVVPSCVIAAGVGVINSLAAPASPAPDHRLHPATRRSPRIGHVHLHLDQDTHLVVAPGTPAPTPPAPARRPTAESLPATCSAWRPCTGARQHPASVYAGPWSRRPGDQLRSGGRNSSPDPAHVHLLRRGAEGHVHLLGRRQKHHPVSNSGGAAAGHSAG